MSVVADILAELSSRGVAVRADGETLRLKPKAALDDDLLARVRAYKPDILAALSGRPATCASSCYEIEPGKWIHRAWDGCKTPMPESAEPIMPARADCGCPGSVCSRCWLCVEVHCQCPRPPKTTCWHCEGAGRCACTACWRRYAGEVAECAVCHGSGKIVERVE
jgi:TubC N-terminal docking domain